LAIDRDKLTTALWNNQTQSETAFQMPKLGDVYWANRKDLTYDPDQARKLLAEGGYKGDPVTIRIVGNYYMNGEAVVQALQAMWQAVGVNAKLEVVENFAKVYEPGAAAGFGGIGYDYMAPEALGVYFWSPNAYTRKRGFPDGVPGLGELAAKFERSEPKAR